MSLFVYNLTGAPVVLAAGSPIVTVPASANPPARSKAYNVTSELKPDITLDPVNGKAGGVLAPGYVALQLQVTNNQLVFEWTSEPEYLTPGLIVSTPADEDAHLVKQTTAELHVYADGALGNNANDGLQKSAGVGGSFSIVGSVVTFTVASGTPFSAVDIGRLFTANYAGNPAVPFSGDNNGSFAITGVPAPNQVTYTNARGVTGAMLVGDPDRPDGRWAVSSPKQTLQAALDVIPSFIAHKTALHLSGTFTNYGFAFADRDIIKDKTFVIDGGMALTIVAPVGSPWVPDIFTAPIPGPSTIGRVGVGWTVDQYAGYFVEIVAGTGAGQTRMIQGNTIDTITPCRNFNTLLDATSLFRIVMPTTTLAGVGTLTLQNKGQGFLQLQGVYTSGNSVILVNNSVGYTLLSHVVTNSTNGVQSVGIYQSHYVNVLGTKINPYLFDTTNEGRATDTQAGLSTLLWVPGSFGIYCRSCPIVSFEQSFVKFLYYNRILSPIIYGGNRVLHFSLTNTFNHVWIFFLLDSSSGYATTKFGGFVHPFLPGRKFPGIYASFSSLAIGAIDISNCTKHAIELVGNSYLHIAGTATGTGNLGAAIYAHANATITLRGPAFPGLPVITPTLTGALGHLSTDGASQFASWADIQAGNGVVDGSELVRAKVYTPVFQQ